MSLDAKALGQLGKDIEEARALLARKHEVEVEITRATSRLAGIEASITDSEKRLAVIDEKVSDQANRFEHERARYAIDLSDFQAQCVATKQADQAAVAAQRAELDRDLARARDHHETEKRRLTGELAGVKAEHDRLAGAVLDFKRRIQALG